jgi:hypothetical protein
VSADLSLASVEARLFALITAPEGVAAGLAALGLHRAELERVIASDTRASAVERLDIYASMYFFRIRDVLAEMFPRLARALGDAHFHNLVTDYLLACPSTHPSLRDVGRRLPAFLDGDRRRSFGGTRARPGWLADLARLEWARHDVFDLADAAPLSPERLRSRPPESFASLPLSLIPAHARVPVRFAVDDTWEALGTGSEAAEPPVAPRTLLVWRAGGDVYHRALEPLEAETLARIASHERPCLGHLCDWLAERIPDEPEAARSAFQLLSQWASEGVLIDVD